MKNSINLVMRFKVLLIAMVFLFLFTQNAIATESGNNACAYACMDWTLGSLQMKNAEQRFKTNTGQDVHFGVGTFMGEGDEVGTDKHLGSCFRLVFRDGQKDIIAQVVNTGYDMTNPNQFDIQMGAGGMGAFNACAGDADISMYPGGKAPWGLVYGGVQNEVDCSNLPEYPVVASDSQTSNNLQTLCKYGFDNTYRGENGRNYKFKYVPERVKCPQELTELTGFYRKDDPSSYDMKLYTPCELGDEYSIACAMTRMMDCAKPTAAWTDHVKQLNISGPVPACQRDGYTRWDKATVPSAASPQCTSGSQQSSYCKEHTGAEVGFCSWDGGNTSGGDYCNANKAQCLSCGGGSWCTCSNGELNGCTDS
tara:strand:- start:134 stop:1231 length:1098 start_codon:yes stop_codon:yes gene_type:complete